MENRIKVLIADGSEAFCGHLKNELQQLDGYDLVGTAADGEEAVRLLEATKPDILVLDLMLAKRDGISVLRYANAMDKPPVGLVTSGVPVAYSWILGSISDQYQYVVQGKIRNYRKILLALAVVSFFFSGAGVLLMANWGTVLVALQGEFSFLHHEVGQAAAATVAGLSAAGLVVYQYISLYDLYQSCNPGNSVAFLVLSAVFPFLASFFLFADRKKERGMPPRREGQATEREPQDSQGAPVAEESWDDPDRDRPVES